MAMSVVKSDVIQINGHGQRYGSLTTSGFRKIRSWLGF